MLKFFPRLKVFKNSTGRNVFDGTRSTSYDWYTYAYVFEKDGEQEIYMVEKAYSSTTGQHMGEFRNLLGFPETKEILAPQGLSNLGAALREITREMNVLNDELKNPRCKKERRLKRIETLQAQILLVKELQERLEQKEDKAA